MSADRDENKTIRDQFTKQAASYASLVQQRSDASMALLLETIEPVPTDLVLDVACGSGSLTLALAMQTAHVVGIDLTPAMLEQAKRLQAESNINNIEWQLGDVAALSFADERFSLVVSRAAFHHMASPAQVLAEMARVCRIGGRIAVFDLTPDPAKAIAFNAIEKLRDPSHARALTATELRALATGLGVEEISVTSFTACDLRLDDVLATSFPEAGAMKKLRRMYSEDAASGANTLGFNARQINGKIIIDYPLTLMVWRRSA
ncbi:MAG TPA: methyltransferase domain-containing protein [Spongiibacteraceae bacterium]